MDIVQHIIAFIFALGLLVTFHEFGHYWVAHRFDVKILRFSVGFGKPLYKKIYGPDKTEFVIAGIPLGGYVKMLDEREGNVEEQELDRAFNRKPLGQRFAIVFAGPAFNFIFAILAYWLVFILGVSGFKPIIGSVEDGSLAAAAGLRSGQEILQVNGRETRIWTSVMDASVAAILEGERLVYHVRDGDQGDFDMNIDISSISVDDIASGQLMKTLGMKPDRQDLPAHVIQVLESSAAERAGMQSGDTIVHADDKPITSGQDWINYVKPRAGETIQVQVRRNEQLVELTVIPDEFEQDGDRIGRVGVMIGLSEQDKENLKATESYGLIESTGKAVSKTFEVALMSLRVLGKMITGEASVRNLSGPISIAQYAGYTAAAGIPFYISFLAVVSVSLGLLNLFPVPLLDGGHLMYYLIEFVKGSPVSESAQVIGQQLGLAVLLGLMSLVFYFDIMRLIG